MTNQDKQILFRYLKEYNLLKAFEEHMKWLLSCYRECGLENISFDNIFMSLDCESLYESFATCHFSTPSIGYNVGLFGTSREYQEMLKFHNYYDRLLKPKIKRI